MKSQLDWTKASTHPLEYRAEAGRTVLILRALKTDPIWEAVIHRDNKPVSITRHHSYHEARAWAEGAV
jgi:hypothetical protein